MITTRTGVAASRRAVNTPNRATGKWSRLLTPVLVLIVLPLAACYPAGCRCGERPPITVPTAVDCDKACGVYWRG